MTGNVDALKGLVPTQRELAVYLGVDPRTVRNWIASGCECETSGGWSVPLALQWAQSNVWRPRLLASPETGDRREDAELRKAEADAAIKEAKAEQLLSALVDRDAVKAAIRVLLDSIRDRLRTIPAEVAGVIPAEFRDDITLDMSDKIELILVEIDSTEPQLVPVGPGCPCDESAAEETEVRDLGD